VKPPASRTFPPPGGESGLIHAVIVPPEVAACRAPATRVRQMLPLLDSSSIGPETYITRIPRRRSGHAPDPAYFAEVDLSAAGAYADEISGVSDGDVCANGFQFGPSCDLPGANVSAPGTQRSVSRNVAHVDVSASGDGRKVTRDI